MSLVGPYLAGCVLLVAAGVAKARRPADTARALGALLPTRARPGLGALTGAVRALALLESALGAAAIVWPRPALAGTVAASYLVFAVVVAHARRRGGPLASCGCFGTPDTPATWLHAIVDLAVAVAAAVVAVAGPGGGGALAELSGQPLHAVPLVVVALVGAGVAYLAMGPAARLGAAAAAVRTVGTWADDAGAGDAPPFTMAAATVPLPDPTRRDARDRIR